MPDLFSPLDLGAIRAPKRVLMAPLARGRATREAVPIPPMAEYCAQRASAGLIISEATGISREGLGWPYAPGLWTDAQAEAWRPVTDAVHAAGGRIVAQLWHMGRQVHSSVIGGQPVSSSATRTEGQARTYEGKQDFETARAWAGRDPWPRASTGCRPTPRTATSSTSSCATAPTSAPIATAARPRTASASSAK